jgi:PAS domain S-box-containing protein
MEDECKTKEQLLDEVIALRQRVSELEKSENERRLGEEALREREEMFRLFMEHSPIYVFFKDEQIRSIELSKNYEKMLGRPVHELIGKTMYDLFPSELAKDMVEDDLRILHEGKPIEVVEELNGRVYTTTKFPIIREGKPPRLAGFTMDITEAKLVEKALRESEERFRTIFNAVSDAIFVQDLATGAIIDVNQRMCDMYGYTHDEALQLNIGV